MKPHKRAPEESALCLEGHQDTQKDGLLGLRAKRSVDGTRNRNVRVTILAGQTKARKVKRHDKWDFHRLSALATRRE